MEQTVKVMKYEKCVVFQNNRFLPNHYTLFFSDGKTITMSFGDINGCIGIGDISEIIGEDYEGFGFINDNGMFYNSDVSQIFA